MVSGSRRIALDVSKEKPQWLLIKGRDDEAQPATHGDILEEKPLSVTTNRDLNAIAGAHGRVWSHPIEVRDIFMADGYSDKKRSVRKKSTNPKHATGSSVRTKSRRTNGSNPMPERIDVELATLTDQPPEGEQWVHEIKFDKAIE